MYQEVLISTVEDVHQVGQGILGLDLFQEIIAIEAEKTILRQDPDLMIEAIGETIVTAKEPGQDPDQEIEIELEEMEKRKTKDH
jgi:hypothetical protein